MVKLQRKFASEGNTIAGQGWNGCIYRQRKIFWMPKEKERARRRYGRLNLRRRISYADVIKDIEILDKRDTRNNCPHKE
jgi:cytidylate kinase